MCAGLAILAAQVKTGAMQRTLFPRYAVIEDFLPSPEAAAWLDFALAHESDFIPTKVYRAAQGAHDPQVRTSLRFAGKLGEPGRMLQQAIAARLPELCREVGLPPYEPSATELDLAVHRDGGHFARHHDSFTEASRDSVPGDRILTAVYYFFREPRGFTGGELALYPFAGDAEPIMIEPRHNALALFPSMALHEVCKTSVPGEAFADARFSINCWPLRAKA